jgi:hypothetical protein
MKTFDDDPDDLLAGSLLEYETELASGRPSTARGKEPSLGSNRSEQVRLEKTKECLQRLERIWPHSRPLDEPVPPTAVR